MYYLIITLIIIILALVYRDLKRSRNLKKHKQQNNGCNNEICIINIDTTLRITNSYNVSHFFPHIEKLSDVCRLEELLQDNLSYKSLKRQIKSGLPFNDMCVINDKNITIRAFPKESVSGETIGHTLILILIENQENRKKNTPLEIDYSEQESLEELLDHIPLTIAVKSATNGYRYTSVNENFCRIINLTKEQIIGKTDFDLYEKEYAEEYRSYDLQVSHKEQPHIFHSEGIFEHTAQYWKVTRIPYQLKSGEKMIIAIAQDLTDMYIMNLELKKAKQQAEEANRLQSIFLANMSHEIRTPLNAIIGFSELLQMTDDPKERSEYMNIIETSNNHLLRLINDILLLSKLEAGVANFKRENFDLIEHLRSVYSNFKGHINNDLVKFELKNLDPKLIVSFDKDRLTQVISNFLSNAIKYTKSGSIELGYEKHDDEIKLYVKDTGIGVPKDKQHRIFYRFEKLDEFAQGTGLGLSICKAIADVADTEINFQSEEGIGSSFWIMLKESTHSNSSAVQNQYTAPKLETPSIDKTHRIYYTPKILIAEDNDSNFKLMKAILKDYRVIRAYNGIDAVNNTRSEAFSAIIMDMKMPKMDGFSATKEIRSFDKTTPIIAVTANAYDSDRTNALDAGCNYFVSKPIRKNEFLKLLGEVIK